MEREQRRYVTTHRIIDLDEQDEEISPRLPEGGGPWELLRTHVVPTSGALGFIWTWGEL